MNNLSGGILILYKDGGITSHDAVNRVRRLYNTKQVGHTGTLDPMATGVLVMLVGRAVKCAEFFDGTVIESTKSYRALLRLGVVTDTGDVTGTVIDRFYSIPAEDDVLAAVSKFKGEIMQIPPMYSALKRGGVKLVDLARQGIEVEREPRPVTISSISAERITDTDYTLEVSCSKGTYIRTLCEDIGKLLGCGGTMAALERTAAHGFGLDGMSGLPAAVTLAQIEALGDDERIALLYPVESLFSNLPHIELPPFFARLARNGCEIYQHKIGTALAEGDYAAFYENDALFAIGRAGMFPDGSAIKAVKLLK